MVDYLCAMWSGAPIRKLDAKCDWLSRPAAAYNVGRDMTAYLGNGLIFDVRRGAVRRRVFRQRAMEIIDIARVVHILAVVLWIGGVAMVTTVLIPAIKQMNSPEEQAEAFKVFQTRFAAQAKFSVLLTGLSGFYMMYHIDGWHRYAELEYWWIHAMTIGWVMFMLILFVLEPLILHRLFMERAKKDPVKPFAIVHRMHIEVDPMVRTVKGSS
jgi:uncharacterized membrane protein